MGGGELGLLRSLKSLCVCVYCQTPIQPVPLSPSFSPSLLRLPSFLPPLAAAANGEKKRRASI